jgi:Icc-related predicted phosphoesterase
MERVYFATDVHGSEVVWRKWCNVQQIHKANILILAGDLTGKALVPIVKKSDGTYICNVFGRTWTMKNESEINEMVKRISGVGYYWKIMTIEEVNELKQNPKKVDNLMKELMVERLKSWLNLLLEKVDAKNTKIVVMPGNDDEKVIDPIIKSYEDRGVIYPLDKVVNLCFDFEMISLDYVNPTPWKTPRECSEEELEKRVKALFNKVKNPRKTICNFHCPPHGTHLDLAPKLDKQLRRVLEAGRPVFIHVGSTAIRKAIEEYQPLIGLHGHIHESFASDKLHKTPVLNPGSEYTEGVLRGFIIDFSQQGVEKFWKVEG